MWDTWKRALEKDVCMYDIGVSTIFKKKSRIKEYVGGPGEYIAQASIACLWLQVWSPALQEESKNRYFGVL